MSRHEPEPAAKVILGPCTPLASRRWYLILPRIMRATEATISPALQTAVGLIVALIHSLTLVTSVG